MNLREYLIEAVARRKTGKYSNGFPYTPSTENIVEFLDVHNFKKVESKFKKQSLSPRELRVLCSDGTQRYTLGLCEPSDPDTFWIAICGGKNGIVWVCRTDIGVNQKTAKLQGGLFRAVLPDGFPGNKTYEEFSTYEEFRKKICEHFNW